MKKNIVLLTLTLLISVHANAKDTVVSDQVVADQRAALESNTQDKGFGPQSPRDIDSVMGTNSRFFNEAPAYTEMNLCNIHLHKNAEHKGGEFTLYAGNGDGKGYHSGHKYSGQLSAAESVLLDTEVCSSTEHGGLQVGNTIEVHYVHSSAKIQPGHTLIDLLKQAFKVCPG